ncbi:MAG: site-2 protease family protein [Chloroflexi bacterium]|nr:site-2 protease family protein [Chloroflexota bacterium]
MFGRSFRIARIGGIDIEVHPSWLLIVVFLAWSLSDGVFPEEYGNWSTAAYWIVGSTAAVLLFVTVLIHELAHALVAIRRGLAVPKITLFIFGGVSHLSRQPRSAGEEFAIAIAGPATSVIIAVVTFVAWLGLRHVESHVAAIAIYLATVNLLLAVFNILPGFPLDGGRVLRSIAWGRTKSFRKATSIAGTVGEVFGYGLMVSGAALLLSGYAINGLWFMLIGWFLTGAARGEKQALQLDSILGQLKARDIMRETYPTVLPSVSVQEVVDRHMIGEGERAAMVARDGAVLGILSVSDVRHLSRDEWANTPVQGIMTPRDKVVTVTAALPALEVLHLLGERRLNQVPVLEEGRMIGLITRRELIERLQLAESLGHDHQDGHPTDGPAPS